MGVFQQPPRGSKWNTPSRLFCNCCFVTTYVVRLPVESPSALSSGPKGLKVERKVFRLKTEGEREPKEFFSGIKQLQ